MRTTPTTCAFLATARVLALISLAALTTACSLTNTAARKLKPVRLAPITAGSTALTPPVRLTVLDSLSTRLNSKASALLSDRKFEVLYKEVHMHVFVGRDNLAPQLALNLNNQIRDCLPEHDLLTKLGPGALTVTLDTSILMMPFYYEMTNMVFAKSERWAFLPDKMLMRAKYIFVPDGGGPSLVGSVSVTGRAPGAKTGLWGGVPSYMRKYYKGYFKTLNLMIGLMAQRITDKLGSIPVAE